MNETPITVTGNITRDPDLRFTAQGRPVANLTVASTPRLFDQANGWRDGETLFMDCTAWGQMAENAAESLLKGARVIVTGTLKYRTWTDKSTGEKRGKPVIEVQDIGPSLRLATAKTQRDNQGGWHQPSRDQWEEQPPF